MEKRPSMHALTSSRAITARVSADPAQHASPGETSIKHSRAKRSPFRVMMLTSHHLSYAP